MCNIAEDLLLSVLATIFCLMLLQEQQGFCDFKVVTMKSAARSWPCQQARGSGAMLLLHFSVGLQRWAHRQHICEVPAL